jgi:hypothetical protein
MSAGVVIMLLVGGTFVLIVLSSVVGARRGSRQFGTADDPAIEHARGQGMIEGQRHDHGGHWG